MAMSGRYFENNNYFTIVNQTGHPVLWTRMHDMDDSAEEGSC